MSYLDEPWEPGPPHIADVPKGAFKDAVCGLCGCMKDRAIHDAAFWAKERQIPLLTGPAYLDWITKRGVQ